MPRLNERKPRPPTVPTFLNLPQSTRDQLEAMIGLPHVKSLTDALIYSASVTTAIVKTKPKARTAK